MRLYLVATLLAAVTLAACGSAAAPTTDPAASVPPATPPATPTTTPSASAVTPSESPPASPVPATGFAFSADAVLGYYQEAGLTCGAPEPSSMADGWIVRECRGRDADGRATVIGVVTDGQGLLGDGYASVTAADGEDVLTPEAALDHLSGFMGAMLGDERATAQLEWLAGSMGNEYEESADADLRIATYLRPADDPRSIWLEVAGADFPAQPGP